MSFHVTGSPATSGGGNKKGRPEGSKLHLGPEGLQLPGFGRPLVWGRDTKWALAGLLFWPLWIRFLPRTRWNLLQKTGFVLATVIGYVMLFGGTATAAVLVVVLLICIPSFLWALRMAEPDPLPKDPWLEQERARLQELVEACNDFVGYLEQNYIVPLGLAPIETRATYQRALEMRGEAVEVFDDVRSREDLIHADSLLHAASDALIRVREQLDELDSQFPAEPAEQAIPEPGSAKRSKGITRDLGKLASLKASGALTEDEFQAAKRKVLD